jgi:hemerythrin-like domain-containing protein
VDCIQIMMDEHQQILRVLDALDGFAAAVRDPPQGKLQLGQFITIIRE